MLSEEKQDLLRQRIAEWGTAQGIPDNIQQMVFTMGVENPQTDEDKQAICTTNFWAPGVVDFYDRFVEYLTSRNSQPTPQPDLLLSLKTLRQLLDQIIEQVEHAK